MIGTNAPSDEGLSQAVGELLKGLRAVHSDLIELIAIVIILRVLVIASLGVLGTCLRELAKLNLAIRRDRTIRSARRYLTNRRQGKQGSESILNLAPRDPGDKRGVHAKPLPQLPLARNARAVIERPRMRARPTTHREARTTQRELPLE